MKAQELKRAGKDIIVLAAGEPDFDTPEHIKNAAIKAINDGFTKYVPGKGTPDLQQAIQKKFKQDNGLDYALSNITVGVGGKHIIYNAFSATINSGDEVIIPAPYWVSYPDIVILNDGVPVVVECGEESGFKLNPEDLEKNITKKTKLILSNKKISKRIDELKQNSPIGNKELAVGIWDLKRFYEVESSESEREEIIIDFTEKPLEALRASSTDEMDSYLVMMPGEKLAEIYGHWKSRILEQNVRSYLQNRSNVNKGILLTLGQMPSRFFAYNNGITTTGETIEFDSTNKHITKIHNLQIVNGGQTTASIYRASREKIASTLPAAPSK